MQTHTTARQFTLRINHSSTSFCPACRDFSWRNYDNHLQAQVSPHSVSLHNKINVKKGAIHHIARHFCLQTTATVTPASYISSSNDSSLPSLSTLASFTKGPLILLVRFCTQLVDHINIPYKPVLLISPKHLAIAPDIVSWKSESNSFTFFQSRFSPVPSPSQRMTSGFEESHQYLSLCIVRDGNLPTLGLYSSWSTTFTSW